MSDPPAIERTQSYRVCGRFVHDSMTREEYNRAFSTGFLSVAEPLDTPAGGIVIYEGRGSTISGDTPYLSFTLEETSTILNGLPGTLAEYGEGRICSFVEDGKYASAFTGKAPLVAEPHPNENTSNPGLRITFGQPDETASEYIFTPKQTHSFREHLSAIKVCQVHDDKYHMTIDGAKTIDSDGSVSQRRTLADLFT